jgi:single-stranded-DNA-specific exonuclease
MAGGGHAMAAGMTLRAHRVDEFRAWLCDRLAEDAARARADDAVDIDALAAPGAGARTLLDTFQVLEPFGPGAPEPVVAIADVRIERPEPVRGGHIRCALVDGLGGRLKAIAWRASDTPLGSRLLAAGASVHVAGRLRRDDWQGRSGVQIEIDDLAESVRRG